MSTDKVQKGYRVRVSPNSELHKGRTGTALEPRGKAKGGGGKRWLVRFDWPLGGMGSYAEVREVDLEILLNIPIK